MLKIIIILNDNVLFLSGNHAKKNVIENIYQF